MNIHQIKNMFPNIGVARYNLAVWQDPNKDSLYFIGREVAKPGQPGEPDMGILKLFEVAPDGSILQEKVIWKPIYDGINLEDPRALELPHENLIIGLTAVLRDKLGKPVPFPAVVKIDSLNSWKHELPPLLIIDTFGPGKNLTPLDTHTFLFRPDSVDYNHKLLVFSVYSQIPEKLADIDFPHNLPWASWRIGTTMPPVWLSPNEALFIMHGISKKIIDGTEKFIYSIGRAKLTRDGNHYTVTIAPEPILTPDNFLDNNGKSLVEELHPELRRVVYSCGGVIKKQVKDKLSLYVNVGDRTTFEVEFSLAELKEGLF
jgi:predicted GH43/DUF377 family glycosyl hydrolase